jgi:dGTPase
VAFAYQVAIPVSRAIMSEATECFTNNLDSYLAGIAPELSDSIPTGKMLKCLKTFARRYIYTDREAQRIEIAGERIVDGLLEHFGRLLTIPRDDFEHFVLHNQLRSGSGLDTEWRIFSQLAKRMIRVYHQNSQACSDVGELDLRAGLIVDYIAGLTDNSALQVYQNFMGIAL